MALIKCTNCEKEVSDKAKICPNCGTQLIEDSIDTETEQLLCEECQTILHPDFKTCPNCGCPVTPKDTNLNSAQRVEVTAVNLQMKKSTKKTIIIAAITIIALVIAALIVSTIVKQNNAEKNSAAYASKLDSISETMILGASEAESVGNLIKLVWYNSIYEVSDSKTNKYTKKNGYGSFYDSFNDALGNLFNDSSFIEDTLIIEMNQSDVEDLMKSLKNPPEEYDDAYDAVKDCYEAYLELTNLALNPSGNLQTYSSNFNNAVSAFLKCYNSLNIYIDN